MKNKLLLEELKRFNKIISYNPENPMINENTESLEVDDIIEKIKPLLPVSKYHNKYRASSLIQAILVDSGYCVYGGKCDYIDGDFGTTTEKSLEKFIGKKELTKDDTETLKTSMLDPYKKGNEVPLKNGVKNYSNTINKYEDKVIDIKNKINKDGIDLKILTPEFQQYFMDWFGFDRKLGITGEDIEKDILKFIVSSEGGISDGPNDETAFKEAMRYPYNTMTKVLNYGGDEHQLKGENLPKPTKSKIDSSSYSSEHWHTNKGIVYGYYADNIGSDSLNTIKSWLNLSDEDVLNYYKDYFYDDTYSKKYDVINHYFGLIKWNSGAGGASQLKNKIKSTFQEYGGIDNAIDKLGLPVVFDILNNLRIEQYMGYKNFEVYGSGWINSILNFYWYFKSKYIDPIADEADDKMSLDLYNMDLDDLENLTNNMEDITDNLT